MNTATCRNHTAPAEGSQWKVAFMGSGLAAFAAPRNDGEAYRFARATICVGLTKRSAMTSQTSVVTM